MKRSRRNQIEESCFDDDNEKILKEDVNKKRSKKSSNHNNIVNIDDNNQDEIYLINYNKYKEDVITKLKQLDYKFDIKPDFFSKLCDINNPMIKKLNKITKFKLISPLEIYYKLKFEEFHKMSLEDDKCSICQFHFYDEDLKSKNLEDILIDNNNQDLIDAVLLNNCTDHFFHLECLDNLIKENEYLKCPNCSKIYGIITGDQPEGTMKVSKANYKCSGYKCGTLVLEYNFPDGDDFTGTYRVAYIPDNEEGREVLALLKVAFDRKLLFTIGTSVTTGQDNTTIWNGVHQKTNLTGGSHNYGYPDLTYFNRVKQELAAKGVIWDNIDISQEIILEKLILSKNKNKK